MFSIFFSKECQIPDHFSNIIENLRRKCRLRITSGFWLIWFRAEHYMITPIKHWFLLLENILIYFWLIFLALVHIFRSFGRYYVLWLFNITRVKTISTSYLSLVNKVRIFIECRKITCYLCLSCYNSKIYLDKPLWHVWLHTNCLVEFFIKTIQYSILLIFKRLWQQLCLKNITTHNTKHDSFLKSMFTFLSESFWSSLYNVNKGT